jgi:sulfur relay (sulfurtransferase) DsrF/TusC family protein
VTLAFPAFSLNEGLNAVLHLSELSDQLDVTLEGSEIVKLALAWVATTQSDAIKQRSCRLFRL